MSAIAVFEAINRRQIESISQHQQLADMFDFMGLRGFKRLHEYRVQHESHVNRKMSKWFINHKLSLIHI
jgi:hypothetical protein